MRVIKRAALYARYSTDMQRTESISAQMRAMEQYCRQQNWKIVAKYIDEAMSATTDKRPRFQQMIEDSSKNMFDVVLVHKLDRFSRNRYDSAIYKSRLKRNGVTLCSVLEKIDDSPESIILEAILEGISEYYSRNLSREVMKGLKENAYQCRHSGGSAPLGYDVDSVGHLVINEHEATIVRLIFQMYIDGYGLLHIADFLNSHNYKTKAGKPFVKDSFQSILHNEKYTGVFVFNHVAEKDYNHKRNSHRYKPESEVIRIENGCPVIICKEMFQQAQKRRKSNYKLGGALHSQNFYLCSGIVKCGVCGKTMNGSKRIKSDFFVYVCSTHKAQCDNIKEISRDKIDKYAAELVENELLSPEKLSERISDLNHKIDEYNQSVLNQRKSISNKLEDVTRNLIKYNDENFVNNDRYIRIEEQRKNLISQLQSLQKISHAEKDSFLEYVTQYTSLEREDVKFRTLLQKFLRSITVHKTKVTFELDIGFGVLNNITEKHSVSRKRFLTPPQEKKMSQTT